MRNYLIKNVTLHKYNYWWGSNLRIPIRMLFFQKNFMNIFFPNIFFSKLFFSNALCTTTYYKYYYLLFYNPWRYHIVCILKKNISKKRKISKCQTATRNYEYLSSLDPTFSWSDQPRSSLTRQAESRQSSIISCRGIRSGYEDDSTLLSTYPTIRLFSIDGPLKSQST